MRQRKKWKQAAKGCGTLDNFLVMSYPTERITNLKLTSWRAETEKIPFTRSKT